MLGRYPVVSICGTSNNLKELEQVQKSMVSVGQITLTIGSYEEADRVAFSDMDARKIEISDYLFILNTDSQLDEKICACIAYAQSHGKKVEYLYSAE